MQDRMPRCFSEYNVPGAFLVNIELTLWSALFSTILGVILVMMRISPIRLAAHRLPAPTSNCSRTCR